MSPSPKKWSCPPKIIFPIFSKNITFFENYVLFSSPGSTMISYFVISESEVPRKFKTTEKELSVIKKKYFYHLFGFVTVNGKFSKKR